jgi:hypothetical protein
MLSFLASLMLAIAYRIRGGGWFTLANAFVCRIIWGGALAFAYDVLVLPSSQFVLAPIFVLTGFLSMLIPHAFCMNIGRWPTPQKSWCTFFMPTYTPAAWAALSPLKRAIYDTIQMAFVGLYRGLIVFGAWMGAEIVLGHPLTIFSGIAAALTVSVLQAFGYVAGWYVPFTITKSLTAKSSEWGEFFNGIAWGAALAVALLV